jgi:hypothetical protein
LSGFAETDRIVARELGLTRHELGVIDGEASSATAEPSLAAPCRAGENYALTPPLYPQPAAERGEEARTGATAPAGVTSFLVQGGRRVVGQGPVVHYSRPVAAPRCATNLRHDPSRKYR